MPSRPLPSRRSRCRASPPFLASPRLAGHACGARVNCPHHAEQESRPMLTAEQNELLTRIGPGTPCGNLMRRYWQPVAAASELEGHKWNMRVRLFGEDLVLFKDREGRLGLIT